MAKKGMHMIGQRGSNEIRDILPVTDRDIETKYQKFNRFFIRRKFCWKICNKF